MQAVNIFRKKRGPQLRKKRSKVREEWGRRNTERNKQDVLLKFTESVKKEKARRSGSV